MALLRLWTIIHAISVHWMGGGNTDDTASSTLDYQRCHEMSIISNSFFFIHFMDPKATVECVRGAEKGIKVSAVAVEIVKAGGSQTELLPETLKKVCPETFSIATPAQSHPSRNCKARKLLRSVMKMRRGEMRISAWNFHKSGRHWQLKCEARSFSCSLYDAINGDNARPASLSLRLNYLRFVIKSKEATIDTSSYSLSVIHSFSVVERLTKLDSLFSSKASTKRCLWRRRKILAGSRPQIHEPSGPSQLPFEGDFHYFECAWVWGESEKRLSLEFTFSLQSEKW